MHPVLTPAPALTTLTADERRAARARLQVALDKAFTHRRVDVAPVEQALADPKVRAVLGTVLNHQGDTALHRVTRDARGLPVLSLLLAAGADPNVRDVHGQGRPPLLLCLDEVVPDAHLALLLDLGADPNCTGPTGDAALGRLLVSGESPSPVVLERLLAAGANPNQVNHQGVSPMMLAIDDGLDWVVEAFVAHEAAQLHETVRSAPWAGANETAPAPQSWRPRL